MLLYAMLCCAMSFYAVLGYVVMLCYTVLLETRVVLCDAKTGLVVLCYAVLCYALLCYELLCYALLCCAMLRCAMLYYAMLYCATLC